MLDVVAALIWREGRFLACRRPLHKARGGLWEFVGGKVEPGETRRDALVRECREELAIEVEPRDIYMEVTHTYPDTTVHLTVLTAAITRGEPTLLEHTELRWITPAEISTLAFCPADDEILERIVADFRACKGKPSAPASIDSPRGSPSGGRTST